MDSKASAKRLLAAERRIEALEHRKRGLSYRAIAAAMKCSEQHAHRLVIGELNRLNEKRAEAAGEVQRLELERLDAMLSGLWPKAAAGDAEAVARVLAIMGRRSKFLGLDAPTQTRFTALPPPVQILEEVVDGPAAASANQAAIPPGSEGVPR